MRDNSSEERGIVLTLAIVSLITGTFWGVIASLMSQSSAVISSVATGSALITFAILALFASATKE